MSWFGHLIDQLLKLHLLYFNGSDLAFCPAPRDRAHLFLYVGRLIIIPDTTDSQFSERLRQTDLV